MLPVGDDVVAVFIGGAPEASVCVGPHRHDPGAVRLILPVGRQATLGASLIMGDVDATTTRVRANNAYPTGTVSPALGTSMHSGAVTVTLTDVSSDVVRVVSSDGAELTAAPWSFPWQAVNRA